MSVMVIDDNVILAAFNVMHDIAYDAPVDWPAGCEMQRDHLGKLTFDSYGKNRLMYLARWSAIFNLRNYVRRYVHHGEFHSVTFKWRRVKAPDNLTIEERRARLAQAIKTLDALIYNILDYYDSAPQLAELRELRELLVALFLNSSPEYRAATWGGI